MNYIWTNRAGVSWTLSIDYNSGTLKVGQECPYYQHGHTDVKVMMSNPRCRGVVGPGGEFYTKTGSV